jgi:hypothetical protein
VVTNANLLAVGKKGVSLQEKMLSMQKNNGFHFKHCNFYVIESNNVLNLVYFSMQAINMGEADLTTFKAIELNSKVHQRFYDVFKSISPLLSL